MSKSEQLRISFSTDSGMANVYDLFVSKLVYNYVTRLEARPILQQPPLP